MCPTSSAVASLCLSFKTEVSIVPKEYYILDPTWLGYCSWLDIAKNDHPSNIMEDDFYAFASQPIQSALASFNDLLEHASPFHDSNEQNSAPSIIADAIACSFLQNYASVCALIGRALLAELIERGGPARILPSLLWAHKISTVGQFWASSSDRLQVSSKNPHHQATSRAPVCSTCSWRGNVVRGKAVSEGHLKGESSLSGTLKWISNAHIPSKVRLLRGRTSLQKHYPDNQGVLVKTSLLYLLEPLIKLFYIRRLCEKYWSNALRSSYYILLRLKDCADSLFSFSTMIWSPSSPRRDLIILFLLLFPLPVPPDPALPFSLMLWLTYLHGAGQLVAGPKLLHTAVEQSVKSKQS